MTGHRLQIESTVTLRDGQVIRGTWVLDLGPEIVEDDVENIEFWLNESSCCMDTFVDRIRWPGPDVPEYLAELRTEGWCSCGHIKSRVIS
jgi:hypothetical protein